ncbi:hypothetical protein IQ07DRAFT_306316 [Pyrenochaeta sp. DS3sAY3a]|nr:hypothetical protein IQ07DRAFT_306316 [Pyrenochaeta sp. DS3sAY3a]
MSDAAQTIQKSRLLCLPGEIRNKIMEYVFYYEPGTEPLPVSQTPLMTLPLTCRQLYAEYQHMALSSTLFSIPWSSMGAINLPAIVDRLPPMSRSAIKKLYMPLTLAPGTNYASCKFSGPNNGRIQFVSAGLQELEQLYISHPSRWVRADNATFVMEHVILKCLRDGKLDKLQKLCISHCNTGLGFGLRAFYDNLSQPTSNVLRKEWDWEPGLKNGELVLISRNQSPPRRIAFKLGFTLYEAENYCLIHELLKKGRHVDIIAARRGHSTHVKSLKDTTDTELTAEIQMLLTNYRMPHLPAEEVASFLEAIRALPQEPSNA